MQEPASTQFTEREPAPDSQNAVRDTALLANLCYGAAYVVDLAMFSVPAPPYRNRWRWTLFGAGTRLAMLFETYWFLDEILPPLQ